MGVSPAPTFGDVSVTRIMATFGRCANVMSFDFGICAFMLRGGGSNTNFHDCTFILGRGTNLLK